MEPVSPINRVALPDFGAHTTRESLAARFDKLTGQLAIVLTPLCFGLSACTDTVVALLFGDRWALAAEVLRVLAIAGWVAGMGSNIGVGFLSLGLYRANAWITAVGAAILIPPLLYGVRVMGPLGAAYAVLFANSATLVVALLVSAREMDYGPIDFVRCIWRPAAAATLMTVTVYLLGVQLGPPPTIVRVALHLAALVCTGALSSVAVLLLLCLICRVTAGAERRTLNLIIRLVRHLTRVVSRR